MTSRYFELRDWQFNIIGYFRSHYFTVLIGLLEVVVSSGLKVWDKTEFL